jgi:hypothetical protein
MQRMQIPFRRRDKSARYTNFFALRAGKQRARMPTPQIALALEPIMIPSFA